MPPSSLSAATPEHSAALNPLVYVVIVSREPQHCLEACQVHRPSDLVLLVGDHPALMQATDKLQAALGEHFPEMRIHQVAVKVRWAGDDLLENQTWVQEVLRPSLEQPALTGKPRYFGLLGGGKGLTLALVLGMAWDRLDYRRRDEALLHGCTINAGQLPGGEALRSEGAAASAVPCSGIVCQPEPEARPQAAPQPGAATHRQAAGAGQADSQQRQAWQTLCSDTFLHTAWGEDAPDNLRAIRLAEQQAEASGDASVVAMLSEHIRRGRHAYDLAAQLQRKLDADGDVGPQLKEWLEKTREHSHPQVYQHVQIQLKKWRQCQQSRREKQTARADKGSVYTSHLAPVALEQGYHPNDISQLRPAARWEVLIDETGRDFSAQAQALPEREPALGRVVALVKEPSVELPPLKKGYHSTDEPAHRVDAVVGSLLNRPQVGIFGFTVKDRMARQHYWVGHVAQLVRWVLYRLPMVPGEPCQVMVNIENRGAYTPEHSERLHGLTEVLQGECQAMDAERFAGLQLTMKVVAKGAHPVLGYADALAYTWGSPAAVSRDRLKRSGLLGSCLLSPGDDEALQRLYLALSQHDRLPAQDWYDLCLAARQEGDNSLLSRFLQRFGTQHIAGHPERWQALLDEVQMRMRLKRYTLEGVAAALEWLTLHASPECSLSGEARLQLVSSQLALSNHLGRVDHQALQQLVTLASRLEDEAAPEVCRALLRATITTTNNFEFAALEPLLQQWVDKPVAVPGRLNHAKLHSTLGQLAAFQGRFDDAEQAFATALDEMALLSDPQQAARDIRQTRVYRLIALLDNPAVDAGLKQRALEANLCDVTRRTTLIDVARRFAHAGQQEVFHHHLLLRSMLMMPEQLQEVTAAYLEKRTSWQFHEGHPWGLIQAYRGWLLWRDHQPEQAKALWQDAVTQCIDDNESATLLWMGAVLRALYQRLGAGDSLDLDIEEHAEALQTEALRARLPHAPHAELEALATLAPGASHAQRWQALSRCLPFNFH